MGFQIEDGVLIKYTEEPGVTEVVIPDGVTEIVSSAFWGCTSLASVTIPEGVTEIGDRAFYECESLTSITLPDGVTEIGKYAFLRLQIAYKHNAPRGHDGDRQLGFFTAAHRLKA